MAVFESGIVLFVQPIWWTSTSQTLGIFYFFFSSLRHYAPHPTILVAMELRSTVFPFVPSLLNCVPAFGAALFDEFPLVRGEALSWNLQHVR